MLNSPIPVNTPGNAVSTRLIWSTAYMSEGLKPVIMGSNRACSSLLSDLYAMAIHASSGQRLWKHAARPAASELLQPHKISLVAEQVRELDKDLAAVIDERTPRAQETVR